MIWKALMSFDSTAPLDALTAAKQLDLFGVELPDAATKWLEKLQELRNRPPEEPPRNRVAELFADSATPAAIDKALAAALSANLKVGQARLAQQIVGRRMLNALIDDRDRLHRELAAHADPIVSRLHEAAVIDETVAELVKQGRVDAAHSVAVAESDCAELCDLFDLRNRYLTPSGTQWSTGWFDCSIWENPWDIASGAVAESDGTKWGFWRAKIRTGGKLWFVPHEVATAASQEHEPADLVKPIDPRRTGHGAFVS